MLVRLLLWLMLLMFDLLYPLDFLRTSSVRSQRQIMVSWPTLPNLLFIYLFIYLIYVRDRSWCPDPRYQTCSTSPPSFPGGSPSWRRCSCRWSPSTRRRWLWKLKYFRVKMVNIFWKYLPLVSCLRAEEDCRVMPLACVWRVGPPDSGPRGVRCDVLGLHQLINWNNIFI